MKTYLITGCYGFLGYSTSVKLLERGHKVVGLDRVQDARSPKSPRVHNLSKYPNFEFKEIDLSNWDQVHTLFSFLPQDIEVMHFAAQYSVPASTKAAQWYAKSNLHGFVNMMAGANERGLTRFHYASSTFVEEGFRPTSMYGATKQFNEDWANVYSQKGMTTVGIRYGSCFGPWCRPDVGIYTQMRRMLRREAIPVRDSFHYQTAFLFSVDAVEATVRLMDASNLKGHNLFTVVAEDQRLDMGQIVRLLEKHSGIQAQCDWIGYTEKGLGGIPQAQCDKLRAAIGWAPTWNMDDSVEAFVKWAKGRFAEGKF